MSAAAARSRAKLPDPSTGSPHGYAELKSYLPTAKQREIALGVTGNTIAAWDRGSASRIVKRHQETVGLALHTLRELGTIVGSPERAGRMYTTPLPLVQDLIPARLVRAGGRAEADVLTKAIRKMQRAAEQTILKRIANDEALWHAVEASLTPTSRAQAKKAENAIDEFIERTGSFSALD